MYYFVDSEIYFAGKKQPPRKVYLPVVHFNNDDTVTCYDNDGDEYTLNKNQIFKEEE